MLAPLPSNTLAPSITHVVMFSGGRASFEAARRVIEKCGAAHTLLLCADTKTEDEDWYRFVEEARRVLDAPMQLLSDGRNIWEVFRDKRFIGNSQIDPCSDVLKRKLLKLYVDETYSRAEVVLHMGLDWGEMHRVRRVRERWELDGWKIDFPLTWDPLLWPEDYSRSIERYGIQSPRLYALGFDHNNCGGGLCEGGQAAVGALVSSISRSLSLARRAGTELEGLSRQGCCDFEG